jgi:hypothetical protein
MATGTLVVGRPEHYGREHEGGIAVVYSYGPRGGEIGSVLIDATNARETIALLEAALVRDAR